MQPFAGRCFYYSRIYINFVKPLPGLVVGRILMSIVCWNFRTLTEL